MQISKTKRAVENFKLNSGYAQKFEGPINFSSVA